jgi:mRNA-degrading endonuclease RelE of RelBE toxin-antitoxin system
MNIIPSKEFIKQTKRLDGFLREKLGKQIRRLIDNPQIGKPLKYKRGERSLYVKPFRLVYAIRGDNLILLKFDYREL